MNELDLALMRLRQTEQSEITAFERSAALLADFAERMRRLKVDPIPVGYYEDFGATGLVGHRRAAAFKQKETGWVLLRKLDGMFVTEDGRLFKGPFLYTLAPGQKKTSEHPYISFYFPPKNGFAFCFNHHQSGAWSAHSSWTFREVPDASGYVGELAAALAQYGG